MLTVYLGARLLYRDRAALNAVGTAALVLLALDPRSLFDASFQLTFGAVLAIAGIGVPLLRRTSEAYRRALSGLDETGRDLTMDPRVAQFRLDLRLLRERLAKLTGRWFAHGVVIGIPQTLVAAYEVLLISIVAQFALTLPMIVYFHRATVCRAVSAATSTAWAKPTPSLSILITNGFGFRACAGTKRSFSKCSI